MKREGALIETSMSLEAIQHPGAGPVSHGIKGARPRGCCGLNQVPSLVIPHPRIPAFDPRRPPPPPFPFFSFCAIWFGPGGYKLDDYRPRLMRHGRVPEVQRREIAQRKKKRKGKVWQKWPPVRLSLWPCTPLTENTMRPPPSPLSF